MVENEGFDGFVVVMQVPGGKPGWINVGEPELVAGDVLKDRPYEVGMDWAVDHIDQDVEGDWRVLVWAGAHNYNPDKPDEIVLPRQVTSSGYVLRGSKARHRPRTRGPKFAVVSKVRVDDDLIGQLILITADKRNTTATRCPGPWYPAAGPEGPVVQVRVRGVGHVDGWQGRDWAAIQTPLGTMSPLPMDLTVIPVSEEN